MLCNYTKHYTVFVGIDWCDGLMQIMISNGDPERLTSFKDALHRVMMGSRGQPLRPLNLNTMQVTIWRCILLLAAHDSYLVIWP